MSPLAAALAREAAVKVAPAVRRFAERLADRTRAAAVLYYGSTLRTGDLAGVLDFYVLTPGPHRTGVRGWLETWLWPEIAFERFAPGDGPALHAKVATLPLAVFARAAAGGDLDTTVWTRFAQPCALVFARDAAAREATVAALAAAAATAGRFAAVLGPPTGPAAAFWTALFRQTYAAELRVEPPGRERQVLAAAPDRYAAVPPRGGAAGGGGGRAVGGSRAPQIEPAARARLERAWRRRRRAGKALNAARLVKAALTTAGSASYAAAKLSRHTGLRLEATPWRERHPILAGLSVLWRLRRRRQPRAR